MAWEARPGIESSTKSTLSVVHPLGLNGLGSPFGIETSVKGVNTVEICKKAKWPGKPVRDGRQQETQRFWQKR